MKKPGDSIQCPHCGKLSFLKKEAVMEGWSKKGDVLKCASCNAVICDYTEEKPCADPLKSASAERLKKLLGEDFAEKVTIQTSEDEQHFCRDCAFLVVHPFHSRCMKTEKEVDPMSDCPAFVRKKER